MDAFASIQLAPGSLRLKFGLPTHGQGGPPSLAELLHLPLEIHLFFSPERSVKVALLTSPSA